MIKKSQKKNLFLDKIIKKLEGTTYKSIVPTVLKNVKKNRKYLKYGKSIENLKGYKFNGNFYTNKTFFYEMELENSVDIDDKNDYEIAKKIMKKGLKNGSAKR